MANKILKYFQKLLNEFSTFFTFSTLAYFIIFLQNFYIIKIIDPSELGTWNILIIFYSFGIQLHLGILNSINKFLPKVQRNNFTKNALDLINPAYSILRIIIVVLFVIFIIFYNHIQSIYPYGSYWIIIFFSTVTYLIFNFNLAILRSTKKFKKVGIILLSEAVISIFFLPLVVIFGLDGLCYRFLLIALFSLIISYYYQDIKYKANFDFIKSKKLLSSGIGIMFISFFNIFVMSQDRLIIEHFFDEYSVGIFHITVVASNIVLLIPSLAGQVFYTNLMNMTKKKSKLALIPFYIFKNSIIYLFISIFVASMLYLLLPTFIIHFYDNYISSIPLLKITLITSLVYSLCICPFYYLVNILSIKNILSFCLITLMSFLILFLLTNYYHYNNLSNIALFQLLSSIFFSICLWILVLTNIKWNLKIER